MVSSLDSGASGLGSSPGRGHCVVFLDKTLYFHSASLHSGVGVSNCPIQFESARKIWPLLELLANIT